MGEWIETTVGEQATLQRGIDITKSEQRVGTVPVISSGGVSSYHDTSIVSGPGVVLGRKGVVGSVYYVPSDYWPHDTTLWVKDFHGNDPRFVYYFFRWMARILAAMDVGSANPTLNRNHVHPIQILWPASIAEQSVIASTLGALDDKIDLNRRMNETLEAIARAIFKDWFVDFGPTRAKMESVAPYLAPKIWALFPNRLDNEGKPAGWEFVPVRDVVDFNPSERLERGQPAPYLDMAALPTSGSWPDAPINRPFSSGSRFRNGDALLARITPCLENGKAAFVQNLPDRIVGWGSTEFIVMRAHVPIPAEYAYLIARDPAFKEQAVRSMTGTSGRQRVQVDSLAEFVVTKPSADVAHEFGTIVTPYFSMIAANARQSDTLAATRDLLLPKLMSGAIRVEVTENVAEAAA